MSVRITVKSMLLSVILLVAGAVTGHAETVDGYQPLVNRQSGLCLTSVPGAGLRQLPCQGAPNQLWRVQPVDGVRYFWLIDKQSGLCMQAALPSADVGQSSCGAVNQQWFIWPEGNASYKITNIAARAGEPNTLEAVGTVVRQGQWAGTRQQQWAFTTAAPPPLTKAWFRSENRGTWWLGEYTVNNPDLVPLSNWVLEFDLPAGAWMGHFWGGTATVSGTHVTARASAGIPAAGSAVFGFTGLGAQVSPANCKLNGLPCAGPMQMLPPPNVHNVGPAQVSLYWLFFAESAVRYDVERNGAMPTSVPGMFFTDPTVQPGGTYAYRVRAWSADGRVSAFSPAITVTIPRP